MNKVTSWTSEIYFVGARRKDGTAPDIEKAVSGKIFLDKEEAEKYCELINSNIKYKFSQNTNQSFQFSVWKAIVTIDRNQEK